MKILIVSRNWLGDAMLASKVVNYYRKKYPKAELVIYGPKAVLELYSYIPAPISLRLFVRDGFLGHWLKFYKETKDEKWFRIINFRPSHIVYLLKGRVIARPLRLGRYNDNKHIVDLHNSMIEDHNPDRFLPKIWFSPKICQSTLIERDLVIINPNGSSLFKMWPNSSFTAFFEKIFSNKKLNNLKFAIIGAKTDVQADLLFKEIARIDKKGRVLNMVGKYSILETQELIKRSKIVISNDTAIMHLAAILNKPLLALFGPTNYKRSGPVNFKNNPNIITIAPKIDYKKFRASVGYTKKNIKTESYMSHITADMVYEKFIQIISNLELDKKAKRSLKATSKDAYFNYTKSKK